MCQVIGYKAMTKKKQNTMLTIITSMDSDLCIITGVG